MNECKQIKNFPKFVITKFDFFYIALQKRMNLHMNELPRLIQTLKVQAYKLRVKVIQLKFELGPFNIKELKPFYIVIM